VIARWARGFAVAAFIPGIVIGVVVFPAVDATGERNFGTAIVFIVWTGVAAALTGMVVGAVSAVAAGMLRPIYIALFRSPEEFEREFGPTSRPRKEDNQ